MPELPEVQTIVNDLNKKIKGEINTSFWSDWKKGIRGNAKKFEEDIKGKKIKSVERIGKNILLKLSGGAIILIHLRMTGALLVKSKNLIKARLFPRQRRACSLTKFAIPQSQALHKHTHHIFYFKSGKLLEFRDIRKFGSIELIDTKRNIKVNSLEKLGIDILDEKFTFLELGRIIRNKKTNIKELLMDQSKIAGIGNIYANEILYEAGISPQRKAERLRLKEIKKLYSAIKKIIKKAIKFRGTSISDYRDASGERGNFQKMLKVYQRAGQKCLKCDTIIKRSVIGQRSTFHCPKCQK